MNTPPSRDELAQVHQPFEAHADARVVGLRPRADVRQSRSLFHGIGLRHIGVPSTAPWPPPGPKTITSYFARRFGGLLRSSPGRCSRTARRRCRTPGATSPSVCVPLHWCRIATRAARAGCIFTDGAAASADGLQAERRRRLVEVGLRDALDDERAAVELRAARLERLLGHLDVGVLQLVAQRDQRVVGVVVDREDRPVAGDAARRLHVALDELHRRVEHLHVGDAHRLHAEALGERPAGVVVRPRLRVVRRPGTGSRAARRRCASTAGPCGRCSCPPGTRAVDRRRRRLAAP